MRARSPGSPGNASGDLGLVRVEREKHRAEHGTVILVETHADLGDELLGSSLRVLPAPGRYLGASPIQVLGLALAVSHRALPGIDPEPALKRASFMPDASLTLAVNAHTGRLPRGRNAGKVGWQKLTSDYSGRAPKSRSARPMRSRASRPQTADCQSNSKTRA